LTECAHLYTAWCGLPAGDFTVAKAPGGKPYFLRYPALRFSISHSGEYWGVAFSGQELGLDIQSHKERNYMALAKRWYHAKEYAAVEQYGPACFFDIWSAKESLVKCSGEGFSAAFSAFSVAAEGKIVPLCDGWQLKPLHIAEGYSACLCGKKLGKIFLEQNPNS
jgi:4'-phosphopantetheinyl transferase